MQKCCDEHAAGFIILFAWQIFSLYCNTNKQNLICEENLVTLYRGTFNLLCIPTIFQNSIKLFLWSCLRFFCVCVCVCVCVWGGGDREREGIGRWRGRERERQHCDRICCCIRPTFFSLWVPQTTPFPIVVVLKEGVCFAILLVTIPMLLWMGYFGSSVLTLFSMLSYLFALH